MFGGVAGDGGEGRRSVVEKLGGEDVEGGGVVDVVPERQDDGFEVCGFGGGDGFGEDGGGAPGDVGEELGVRVLEADEVVAAVVRRAEDDAVAGLCEFGDGLLEGCGRDGGGVGVDEADAAVAAGEKVFGGGEETLAEAVAALRDQGEAGGEEGVEEGFVADGSVGDDAGGVAGCCDGGDVVCGVAKEADVDGCGLIESEWRSEAGFDLAGARSLCHDGEGALAGSRGEGIRGIEDRVGHGGGHGTRPCSSRRAALPATAPGRRDSAARFFADGVLVPAIVLEIDGAPGL